MKKLRLLYTETCDRKCPDCCNKDWELDKLPSFELYDAKLFSEILITGGEPMLYPIGVDHLCVQIKDRYPKVKIYIYTARTKDWNRYHEKLLKIVDGFTITIHDQQSADEFIGTEKYLREFTDGYKGLSMRLNVFKGVTMSYPEGFIVKDNITWIKDCPLPVNETFMKL
jgi:hypothetical protein